MMDFEQIKKHVIDKLKQSLPAFLTYHNIHHTLDVLNQAVSIANNESIDSDEDLFLIKTAALYHDTGFLYIYKGHEEKSCEIATEELMTFGLNNRHVISICEMIRATKIPQSPKNFLAKILCDADLDYLGRTDFYSIGEGLFKEFLHQKVVNNELEWNQLQVKFLESHVYFTNTCKSKREQLKQQHLDELRKKITLGA